MPRYYLVKGKPGLLVGDPRQNATGEPMFAGQQRLSGEKVRALIKERGPISLKDQFEPCEQVHPEDPGLNKALRNGELELLAGPTDCHSMGHARSVLTGDSAPKPDPKWLPKKAAPKAPSGGSKAAKGSKG